MSAAERSTERAAPGIGRPGPARHLGGTLTYDMSCSDGAPSGSTENGLRAIVSGLSP